MNGGNCKFSKGRIINEWLTGDEESDDNEGGEEEWKEVYCIETNEI